MTHDILNKLPPEAIPWNGGSGFPPPVCRETRACERGGFDKPTKC